LVSESVFMASVKGNCWRVPKGEAKLHFSGFGVTQELHFGCAKGNKISHFGVWRDGDRPIRRALIILSAAMLLCCTGMFGGAIYARHQAWTLIEELRNLDTAPDPTAVSQSLLRKYGDRLVSKHCERDFCQSELLFTNAIISRVHAAPRSEIRIYLGIYAGSISSISVAYTSAVFKADSPIVWVQEDYCGDRTDINCEHFAINPHGRNVGPAWNGDIEFGQKATREQKRAAWALNLDCFVAFRGCKDISQLLPTLWKLTGPGAVSSRMRSTADSIAEDSQPRQE
jgi:hypothetical protein